MIEISALLKEARQVHETVGKNTEISGIVSDSRKANERQAFACLWGHHTDGHLYVQDAYERGCRTFICEKNMAFPNGVTVIKTDNVRGLCCEMMLALYGHPERKMTFIGVTGTKGKTTVVYYLQTILEKLGHKTASIGTLGIRYNGEIIETENTTPDQFTLFPLLEKMQKSGVEYVVLEASSQSLKDERLSFLPIIVGIFTCLGVDHIGKFEHPTFQNYYQSKQKLFRDFPIELAVCNADDPYADVMTEGKNTVKISQNPGADFVYRVLSQTPFSTVFEVNGQTYSLEKPGGFTVVNALLATVTASKLTGVALAELLPVLAETDVPGRLLHLKKNGVDFVVDYAHNALSISAVCEYYRDKIGGRLFAVIGSVGERGEKRRDGIAKTLERYADLSILTSDNPGNESPRKICLEIWKNYRDKRKAVVVPNRYEAVKWAEKNRGTGRPRFASRKRGRALCRRRENLYR